MPRASRIWNSGIQYTPVDSIATVSTRHCCSQSAKACKILGKGGKRSYRVGVAIGGYGDKNLRRPNVDPASVGSQSRQTPVQLSDASWSLVFAMDRLRCMKFGNEPGVQKLKISQAGSSQHKHRVACHQCFAHGPGIKLLDGLPNKHQWGTTYAYRCRVLIFYNPATPDNAKVPYVIAPATRRWRTPEGRGWPEGPGEG